MARLNNGSISSATSRGTGTGNLSSPQTHQLAEPKVKHKRSTIACKRCNQRRVRCDVSIKGAPCSSCRNGGHVDCELIESRRARGKEGRYTKLSESPSTECRQQPLSNATTELDGAQIIDHLVQQPDGMTVVKPPMSRRLNPDVWTQLLGNSQTVVRDSGHITYVGESWTLSYVLHQTQTQPHANQLHFSPPVVSPLPGQPKVLATLDQLDLQRKGAFVLPSLEHQHEIIKIFFEFVYPAYPILHAHKFHGEVEDGTCSKLLLQCVLYMGITHSDMETIRKLGYSSRLDAIETTYNRARTLFESDAENNRVTIVQAAFFLQFYWANPVEPKDTWYWLGVAIRQAQALGMHRSTKRSKMNYDDQCLWKRIWWSCYVRDRHASSALGKPMMIQEDDCDVEALDESDFANDTPPDHILYAMYMASLSQKLTYVIQCEFMPGLRKRTIWNKEECHRHLTFWEESLPDEMSILGGSGRKVSFWAHVLHMSYK